jgi:hypothetical protein
MWFPAPKVLKQLSFTNLTFHFSSTFAQGLAKKTTFLGPSYGSLWQMSAKYIEIDPPFCGFAVATTEVEFPPERISSANPPIFQHNTFAIGGYETVHHQPTA